ncbi:hypothetical protein HDU79_011510 [Rhizoclosmatium sp. JEL0117]|nr:hypothetical protein HDU79_011510 [Rhizoclosmatium sp. JEL0117]
MQRQPSDMISADSFLRDTQALLNNIPSTSSTPTLPATTTAASLESQLESAFSGFKVSLAVYLLLQNMDGKTARKTFTMRARRYYTSGRTLTNVFVSPYISANATISSATTSNAYRVRRTEAMRSSRRGRELRELVELAAARAPYDSQQQQETHASIMRETRTLLALGLI